MQVSPEYSPSSKWQRVAPSGTDWTKFRMSSEPETGQVRHRFSGGTLPQGPPLMKPWPAVRERQWPAVRDAAVRSDAPYGERSTRYPSDAG